MSTERPTTGSRSNETGCLQTGSLGCTLALVLGLGLAFGGDVAQAQVPLYEPAESAIDRPGDLPEDPTRREDGVHRDLRSIERFRMGCEGGLAPHELTLFGNGTIRWRTEVDGEPEMRLRELGPPELAGYLRRLEAVQRRADLPPQVTRGRGVGGPETAHCTVRLDLEPFEPLRYDYGIFESVPLAVATLRQIGDELSQDLEPLLPPERLPDAYEPVFGDRLKRWDAVECDVIGLTDDGVGLIVEPVGQPIREVYRLDDLRKVFIGVVDLARR